MYVATTNDLPGFRVTRQIGLVRGVTVRSRNAISDAIGGVQSMLGGRVGAYEIAPASPALIHALRASADEDQLTAIARQDGFLSFGDDAFLKARRGMTTLSEVHRIVGGGD